MSFTPESRSFSDKAPALNRISAAKGTSMLDFIIALITSALAGTGVGGGGLLVIYLTLVKDMEQLPKASTSRFSSPEPSPPSSFISASAI